VWVNEGKGFGALLGENGFSRICQREEGRSWKSKKRSRIFPPEFVRERHEVTVCDAEGTSRAKRKLGKKLLGGIGIIYQ